MTIRKYLLAAALCLASSVVNAQCVPYTPTDQSVAGLSFVLSDVQQCQDANFVYVYGVLIFPTTVSTANVSLSLPTTVPDKRSANNTCGFVAGDGVHDSYVCAVRNTATMEFYISAAPGGNRKNSDMSAKTVSISLRYPLQ